MRDMRQLLLVCEKYAAQFTIIFDESKSKYLYIAPNKFKSSIYGSTPELNTCGKPVVYVDQWPQLGHMFTQDFDDASDLIRRNKLCYQFNNVLCFFNK
jgi:hypothetical protein